MTSNLNKKFLFIFKQFGFGLFDHINLSETERKKLYKKMPGTWLMATSCYTILDNFCSKVFENRDQVFSKQSNLLLKIKNVEKNKYQMFINEVDVTPSTNKEKVSKGAMSQYIRMLACFKLISWENIEQKEFSKIILNEGYFKLNLNFYRLIKKNIKDEIFDIKNIFNKIAKSTISNKKYLKCFYYSLFIYITLKLDESLIYKNESYLNDFVFSLSERDVKKDNLKAGEYNLKTRLDKLSGETTYKSGATTYNHLSKNLIFQIANILNLQTNNLSESNILNELNNDSKQKILEYFFNSIIEHFDLSNESDFVSESLEYVEKYVPNFDLYEEIKIEKIVSNQRAQLRKNILESRNVNNDEYYSDLEPIDSQNTYLPDHIDQQEAAHIYSVSEIKKKILKGNNEYYDILSDPNNGLLMDKIYHNAFDRDWFEFDTNGCMIPNDGWNERYSNNQYTKKYPLLKIKKSTFNKIMMSYFELIKK